MRKTLAVAVLALLAVAGCSDATGPQDSEWDYRSSRDALSGQNILLAEVRSENFVNFKFPYEGAQRGTLTLRAHPTQGKDVILSFERGQFLCLFGCNVSVRFDEGPIISWPAVGAADLQTELIFLKNHDNFVQMLAGASTVLIQAQVYQEGTPTFEFKVGGFSSTRYAAGS